MKILKDLTNLKLHNTIITLGKFDGNHIGHRRLFDTAVSLKKEGMSVVIFTFSVHPDMLLKKEHPRLLEASGGYSSDEYPEGVDYLVEFPFNKETMSMEPERFVKEILVDKLDVKIIVAGEDFRFGKDRAGDVNLLKELGVRYGFTTEVVEKVMVQFSGMQSPREVSSTFIKNEIRKGHMENAAFMLGHPFRITGEVLHGKHLGSTIGFPTLNQKVSEDQLLPPDGVYATRTQIAGRTCNSITNVGVRPTFDDGTEHTVETFVFDFSEDVYGQIVTVSFYSFIRPEQKFAGPEELAARMNLDKQQVLSYFSSPEH